MDLTQLLSQFLYSRLPQLSGPPSGVLTVSTEEAQTGANTTETDLRTYSLPANTLSRDGQVIRITAWGTLAANGNTKTTTLYFGGSGVVAKGSASSDVSWRAVAEVIRSGASAELGQGQIFHGGALSSAAVMSVSEDTTAAITIKVTGQNGTASAGDIVFKGWLIELLN